MTARPGITRSEIASDLAALGIKPGDHVLTHSSLSAIGWVEGGAQAVVSAIVEAVGEEGTALFPTLTGSPRDSRENPPVMDARNTPCWTGAIPEASRLFPDAIRSLHPTHSVAAIGRLAEWFAAGHQFCRTPCGYGSPYDKLADIGGKILLLGVPQSVNTSFHHAEELARVPYVCKEEPVDAKVIDADGHEVPLPHVYIHGWNVDAPRDYPGLEPEMLRLGMLKCGNIGQAQSRLIDATAQRKFLVERLLADPNAVLSAQAPWRSQ